MVPEAQSTKVNHQVVIPDITPCHSLGSELELSPLSWTVLVAFQLSWPLKFADNVTTPTAVLEGTWKKLAELLSDSTNLFLAQVVHQLHEWMQASPVRGHILSHQGKMVGLP